jgi:DNA-binding NarL/FixJ family response regulator
MEIESIHVLHVDDQAPMRRGLRSLLRQQPDIVIAGEAADGSEAVSLADRLQPDVVIMDLLMPGLSGLEATRQIVSANPHIRVLVLTMSDDDQSVFAALQAGARGYLLKGASKAEILRAIRAVSSGEAIFGPGVAQLLLHYFAAVHPNLPAHVFPELTEREREILGLMTQRLTNTEIADRLVLSPKTIRNHVSSIFTKLQVADRTQAILRAREAGLGASRKDMSAWEP